MSKRLHPVLLIQDFHMPEKSTKIITVDGKDYSYEGRLRIAGKTQDQLAELVSEKFSTVPATEQLKIVAFLISNRGSSDGKGMEKPGEQPTAKGASVPKVQVIAKKLGISPEELKKRFSELDQFDAANK